VNNEALAEEDAASTTDPIASFRLAGTIQLGGKGWRRGFFRKTRREQGAGRWKARNERTTKLLRKKTQPARPIQLNRSG
jgi:hypothetical protein